MSAAITSVLIQDAMRMCRGLVGWMVNSTDFGKTTSEAQALSFLICKIKVMIISVSQDCCEEPMSVKYLALYKHSVNFPFRY